MVNIGGYEIKAPSLTGGALGSLMTTLFWSFLIFVTAGLLGWWFWTSYKNKAIYKTSLTLTWYLENGAKKTITGLRGGRFINRHGVWDFKVKIPKQLKPKELGYTPDFSKADADGTIHFLTAGDGTIWQQMEHRIQTKETIYKDEKGKEKVVEEYELIMKPIRTDVKTVTVNSIKGWHEMIDKKKVTIFAIGLGMFLIMVIAHLVSLYIQARLRCPATAP